MKYFWKDNLHLNLPGVIMLCRVFPSIVIEKNFRTNDCVPVSVRLMCFS